LKHSPDCGWAICAAIERQDEEISTEYPLSTRLFEARKATFSDKWPHEGKKGWKCKVKQVCSVKKIANESTYIFLVGGCRMEIYSYTRK
jgi:hypothetical protein